MEQKKIKITLIGSPIKLPPKRFANIVGLGLKKLGSMSILEDTPAVRGMIKKVAHLVRVEG